MNFLDIQTRIQNYINDTSAGTLTIIKQSINQQAQGIMQRGLWLFAMRQTTVTATAGVTDYYLPSEVDKIVEIWQTNTPLQLKKVWIGDFDRLIPNPQASAAPRYYMELNEDRVGAQPTTSHKVILRSSSTQDIATQSGATKVSIWGITGGVDRTELTSLSSTNYISSVNAFTKIYSITPDIAPVGTLTFSEEAVGTVLLNLYPNEMSRTYKKFKVHPIPDQTYTLNVRFQAGQPKLVNNSDVLVLPDRFSDIIYEAVIYDHLLKQGDEKAIVHKQLYEESLQRMTREQDMMWDYIPSVRQQDNGGAYIDSSYPFSYF